MAELTAEELAATQLYNKIDQIFRKRHTAADVILVLQHAFRNAEAVQRERDAKIVEADITKARKYNLHIMFKRDTFNKALLQIAAAIRQG